MPRTKNAKLTEDNFGKLTGVESVLNSPELYIGSVKQESRKAYHYIETENGPKVELRETKVPVAIPHCFGELLNNVADNAVKSVEADIDPGDCEITVKKNKVTITSYGLGIPVAMDPKYDQMIPNYIFSDLNSGSSFAKYNKGKARTGGGRHGIGSKGVNIMSRFFSVEVFDAKNRKHYNMYWKNNLSEIGKESIEKYRGEESKVIITYCLDMEKFGYKRKDSYCESTLAIFRWMAACLSFTAKMVVTFNDERFDYRKAKKFGQLYCENKMTKFYIHEAEDVQLIAIDTPFRGKQLGFCNSIINTSGGIHVNTALKDLTDAIVKKKNEDIEKQNDKTGEKGKTIDVKDIKRHITLLISISIDNPEWGGGQQKTKLSSPKPKLKIPKDAYLKFKTWGFNKAIDAQLEEKVLDEIIKNSVEGQVRRLKKKIRGDDADWIGTKDFEKWLKLVLSIVEGDSAAQYEKQVLDYIKTGRKTHGVMQIRGKIMNAMKKKQIVAISNLEISELIARMNLRVNVDYTIEKNYRTLRYPTLQLMTDPDLDGFHISGLILAIFQHFFPTILMRGDVVCTWIRPVVELKNVKGKTIHRFYTLKEYYAWLEENPGGDLKVNYIKGLGTCTPEDIKNDVKYRKLLYFKYDKRAADKINLAFGKENEDARKDWINAWDPEKQKELGEDEIPIARFIDWYVREYSYDTVSRNLPRIDGFTRVRGKIIYTAFDASVFGRECNRKNKPKVSNFAGMVGTKTHYHQGDNSIPKSVIGMAADFVGSNNLNFLIGKGSFGSISCGLKDAASPRYTHLVGNPLLALLIPPAFDPLLEHIYEGKDRLEPKFFVAILPLVLFNGFRGISTGWGSYFASYHPREIANAYLDWLVNEKPFPELTPWSRGYEGTMYMEDKVLVTKGLVEKVTSDSCRVTCLPLGMWHKRYEEDVIKPMLESGRISDYRPLCTATKTRFDLIGINIKTPEGEERDYNIEDIGLVSRHSLNNMTIVDQHGKVKTYNSTAKFMSDYAEFCLPYYVKRKEMMICYNRDLLTMLKERRKYIQAIEEGKLVTSERGKKLDEKEVLKAIEEAGFNTDFYKKRRVTKKVVKKDDESEEEEEKPEVGKKVVNYTIVTEHDKSIQGVKRLEDEIEKAQKEFDRMSKITPKKIWIDDIQAFLKAYDERYGDDTRVTYI